MPGSLFRLTRRRSEPVLELIIVGRLERDSDHEVDVQFARSGFRDIGLGLRPRLAGQLLELDVRT